MINHSLIADIRDYQLVAPSEDALGSKTHFPLQLYPDESAHYLLGYFDYVNFNQTPAQDEFIETNLTPKQMAERAERLERVCRFNKSIVIHGTKVSHNDRLKVDVDIVEHIITCNISQLFDTTMSVTTSTSNGERDYAWRIAKDVFHRGDESEDTGAMFVNGHWARHLIVSRSNLLTQLRLIYHEW